ISMETYLSWARDHWGLTSLKAHYFTEKNLPAKVWQQWQDKYSWSEELLPIAEWQNHLLVAGLQPPDFQQLAGSPVIFILAPLQGLQLWWSQIEDATQKKTQTSLHEGQSPVQAEVKTPSSLPPTTENLFELEPPAAEYDNASAEEDFSLQDSAPQGFLSEKTLSVAKIQLKTEEELNPKWKQMVKTETMVNTSIVIPAKPGKSDATFASTISKVGSLASATKSEIILPNKVEEKTIFGKTSNKVVENYYLEKIKSKDPSRIDLECNESLRVMKSYFSQSLIVEFNEQQTLFKVFSKGEDWSQVLDPHQSLDLKSPSLFYIVHTSGKAFHGKVYPSAINDEFFKNWSAEQYPEHATAAPLIVQDKVIGALVGFAKAEAYNKTVLQFVEKTAQDLSQKLSKYKFLIKAA
ncbi:MAG: hypothetical protein ACOYOK_06515, partial [Pseudobdellovibrionaceae bacterium]